MVLSMIPSGWKGYLGGFLLILGGLGLGADYVGQMAGIDVFPSETTWPQVVEMIGLGLAALGIRHRQDRS